MSSLFTGIRPNNKAMSRTIFCAKLRRDLPGLDKPPYKNELGQRIYEKISQDAWQMWMSQSVILINHYGLSLGDLKAHEFLMQQMEDYFFGPDAEMPEGWTPEGVAGPGLQQTKGQQSK